MKEAFIRLRNLKEKLGYKLILKPILFRFDPEDVHDRMIYFGSFLGRHLLTKKFTRLCFGYSHPSLKQNIKGINFPNPVGLAAGFDKNGEILDILPDVGFGFMEAGSITGEPCAGSKAIKLVIRLTRIAQWLTIFMP